VVFAAGDGVVVEPGGPGAGVAGVAGEVADGVAELLVGDRELPRFLPASYSQVSLTGPLEFAVTLAVRPVDHPSGESADRLASRVCTRHPAPPLRGGRLCTSGGVRLLGKGFDG
jgi:hypothetical protein